MGSKETTCHAPQEYQNERGLKKIWLTQITPLYIAYVIIAYVPRKP